MANRILRASLYSSPDQQLPLTVIARECDLAVPIHKAAEDMEAQGGRSCSLVVTDIFEVPDNVYADPVRSSMEGSGRLTADRLQIEHNMAISYFWNADRLALVAPRGVLANPGPAPLTADQLQLVMRQLSRHVNYRGQVLLFRASDDTVVTFREGTFAVHPPSFMAGTRITPSEPVAIKQNDVVDQGSPLPGEGGGSDPGDKGA